jgi:tetratricopeptide (TPR) repeat protein
MLPAAEYVGRSACAECHEAQESLWEDSHHDLAMQSAEDGTVLGDFDNAETSHYGVTSSFFRKDGKFMVRTEGPDGKLQEYQVKYTFGVTPLQQYLVEFPGGRLQALSLAWDTRPTAEGGQRWFHLYPDEKIAHDDELHWTRLSQNWNSMCADCHSTDLKKNYDAGNRTFSTTWAEIDVSCEACHGPGSAHVAWAKEAPGRGTPVEDKGFVVSFDERRGVLWQMNTETGNAARSRPRNSNVEIEACAHCHSRRSPISNNYVHGKPLLDQYLPSRLTDRLYYADGQIDGEVYVYGSFLQSKMFQAGVTCSDCHDPHSLALKAPGNGVCAQCHLAEKYDNKTHHFHEAGSPGASCAECHMPPRTYMVVDPRHDHSMRVPRPDLSAQLGTPNACNDCHQDRDAAWAAAQVKAWYGRTPSGFQRYARAFHAARHELPGTGDMLAAQALNTSTPSIARATALEEIGPYLSASTVAAVEAGLSDQDPLVRASAIAPLDYAPPEIRVPYAFPLLSDPIRAVRIEAARVLAPIPAGDLTESQRQLLEAGIREYVDAQMAMAERPEAQVNLGILYASMGDAERAIAAYRTALEIDPAYVPGYVNLADVYRSQGNEAEAEKVLRQAASTHPGNADVHYALGLTLVREQRTDQGLAELRLAADLNPANARYVYVYGVALNSTGNPDKAIAVLEQGLKMHPYNRDILGALAAFYRDMGNQAASQSYVERLRAVSP